MKTEHCKTYIAELEKKFETERAREHAYRPALQSFFEAISGLNVVNDPKRSEYGAPDFVFLKGKTLVIAYAEAKDITVSLDETAKSEQLERYYGYSNLILTNYLEFRFYRNGVPYSDPIKIGEVKENKIVPIETNFSSLEDALKDFLEQAREPITSGAILSKVMAGKARRIRDNIRNFLKSGDEKKNESLLDVFNVIKKLLLADLDYEKFADMYAQTLVYGLFVARFYDNPEDIFTRQRARDLVPASNPFLRHFFDHIAGASFDSRLEFIVNELCEEFTHSDVRRIVHNYYKTDKDPSRDPIIHFYEDFLKEYDPKERLKMGVFYTPLPVVDFIVRSIDEILKKDFNLQGLADSSKVEIVRKVQNTKVKKEVHRVQLLDPATGTGTFLNETILYIKKSLVGQEGRWSKYVKQELLPRLHGFELMMAPYTIAHLKISSTLKETGAEIGGDRIGIYLTNSLEEVESKQPDLFNVGLAQALTKEAQEAGEVKNELPIMVVMGNPPYSVSSQNKGEWIQDLIKVYKQDLKERNIQPLSDDYIKFIRFAEHFIEKNGTGIVAMITNNSYLDGIIHRQMRKHLLETFNKIYILDLHGSAKKNEKASDGGKDENIFAIQQGVAISIFVRTSTTKKTLGDVYHAELYGKRDHKFEELNKLNISEMTWKKLACIVPHYFFVPKNFTAIGEYEKGFKLDELFSAYSMGIATARDDQLIRFEKSDIELFVNDFEQLDKNEFLRKYDFPKETEDWRYDDAKKDLIDAHISPISYRPFDDRWTIYSGNAKGVMARPRGEVMKHLLRENIGLGVCKNIRKQYDPVFISKFVTDKSLLSSLDNSYIFPLYFYPGDGSRVPNLKREILANLEKIVGKTTPENIFDYIYAVLYSPSYRKKYKEFLKIDFPRVPYPKDDRQFLELVKLGGELRKLHLLENPKLSDFITTYPKSGDNSVEKVEYKDGNVYINKTQYFGSVPKEAWEFYIGGYQPAQKWLKDRKSRVLSDEEITHYQKMIGALVATGELMAEIDKVTLDASMDCAASAE